jgi:uncharacterized protein (TIGR02145 family)
LPSKEEWDKLIEAVGGSETAETKLKATSGWSEKSNGTDNYGFSALPGVFGNSGGRFFVIGPRWWSASEHKYYGGSAYFCGMGYRCCSIKESAYLDYGSKGYLYSVRCLQD